MAERRMFAKSMIGSARFLRMPPTSRLLYYDLGMTAIRDWGTNNQIRRDLYHPSVYAELLVKVESGEVETTDGLPFGNQMESEVRLG